MSRKWFEDRIKFIRVSSSVVRLVAPSDVTIGGKQYHLTSNIDLTVSSLTANTLYFVYAVVSAGSVILVSSINVNSTGPVGYTSWKLVGAFYSNGISTPVIGSVVNIEGAPKTEQIEFTSTLNNFSASPTQKCIWRRDGEKLLTEVRVTTSGATASNMTWQGPSNLTIDFTKQNQATYSHVGYCSADNQSGVLNTGQCLILGGSGFTINSYSSAGQWGAAIPHTWANTHDYDSDCEFYITGWSNTPLKDL